MKPTSQKNPTTKIESVRSPVSMKINDIKNHYKTEQIGQTYLKKYDLHKLQTKLPV